MLRLPVERRVGRVVEQLVVVGQRALAHVELRQRLRIGGEARLQRFKFGQLTGLQQVGELCRQRCLAATIMSQGQQPDHAPARRALIKGVEQRIEGAPVRVAGNS